MATEREELYRKMALARRAEESIQREYFHDEMKTPVHLGIGAEAIAVGVLHALPEKTPIYGTYRNHNLYLSLGGDTDGFFGELYGKATGAAKGKAGSMHLSAPEQGLILTSAVVSTSIPVAVGAAFARRYRGENGPVAAFFGDGAIEEGVFWESLNFAALHKLNIIFVCEDNDLAIHTFKKDRQALRSIEEAMRSFGCRYSRADGRDVEAVLSLTRSTLADMQTEPGPAFLHFDYFRFLQHVGPLADFDAGYRQEPALLSEHHDPLSLYREKLVMAGVKEEALSRIELAVDRQIEASIRMAQNAPFPAAEELVLDVYADTESRRI